jgi:hypothetical protein
VGFYPFRGPDASLTLDHNSTLVESTNSFIEQAPNRHVEERDG